MHGDLAAWASELGVLRPGGAGLRVDCYRTVSMGSRRLYTRSFVVRMVSTVEESENKKFESFRLRIIK